MIEKYFESRVPSPGSRVIDDLSKELTNLIATTPEAVNKSMNELAFSEALAAIWKLVNHSNIYIEKQAPWALAKKGEKDQLALVLNTLIAVLKLISEIITPFMPMTASRIQAQLNLGGEKIAKAEPLFPRVQK